MEIVTALNELDHANADHWTGEGLPRLDVVIEKVGEKVTRQQVTDALPGFVNKLPEPETEAASNVPILDLPMRDVLASHELTCEAIDVLSEVNRDLLKERSAIDAELKQVSVKSQILERARVTHERAAGGDRNTANIQAYLAQSRKNREERALRAQRFIAAGTSPEDVKKQLTSKSPVDQAMARKTQRGGARPVRPLLT